jgi:hypothetical protein
MENLGKNINTLVKGIRRRGDLEIDSLKAKR